MTIKINELQVKRVTVNLGEKDIATELIQFKVDKTFSIQFHTNDNLMHVDVNFKKLEDLELFSNRIIKFIETLNNESEPKEETKEP
jgi:hypothetical protein